MSDPGLEERMDFGPSNFQVIAPNEMPELVRVKNIVHEIHKDSQLKRILGWCIRYRLLSLSLHFNNINSG